MAISKKLYDRFRKPTPTAGFSTLFSSEAVAAEPGVGDATPRFKALRPPIRFFKVGIGLSLLMAGGYAILSDRQFLSTDSAVVTAYLTEVRTPVDGTLTGMPLYAGIHVAEGSVMGSVDNSLYDQQHLENLKILEQQAKSGADAARAEQIALQNEERDLLERARVDMVAVSTRLRNQAAEADRLHSARVAELEQAQRELARGRQLHDAGILSDSEFEKLQSQYTVAVANEGAQRSNVDTIRAEIQSAESGTLSEAGMNNDVPYSRQRADEVAMRLAQIEQTQVALNAQAGEANLNVASESNRITRMKHSDLISPISGLLWKLKAANGERISTGDAVAQLVDCDRSFVLAEVAQSRVPEIGVGTQARFRLSGESQERYGRVTEINGDLQRDDRSKLAAAPLQKPHENVATIRISLEGTNKGECAVGRSARVLIAVKGVSPISSLLGHYFQ